MPGISDIQTVYATELQPKVIRFQPYGELPTDDIRALFGLSDAELPDDMLMQRVYTREVEAALLTIEPTLLDTWVDRVAAKPQLRTLVEDFQLYCLADKLCDVLPLIAARSISDSKATFQRFDVDLQMVIAKIRQRYALALKNLVEALEDAKATEIRMPALFGSGKPSYDPVTGATS